ncbi:reductive dehalogenase [Desulfobaculum bizertense]|uniref:Reductive dehalogenase n=1 Tax=Desulfobaculum bizertense DSM 18034 TaxID=1121442 RepID=A0A1T4VRF2_9BACT|nr:reductive dehalogenase [Desulfobaculum bizertense]SKA67499.1 reductive dehalogenase [Desulfobaculum bizertense DSM 18034]
MESKEHTSGLNRRQFTKLLGGLSVGATSAALAGPLSQAAAAEEKSQDLRAQFRKVKNPIKIDEKTFKRFNGKNLTFNALPRDTNQNSLGEMFHRAMTNWPTGEIGKDLPKVSVADARTQMAFLYGMERMNTLTGHHGEGMENKGPLSWNDENGDEPVPHFPAPSLSDPVELTKLAKICARLAGADLVGICKLNRNWIYSDVQRNPYIPDPPITKKISFEDAERPLETDDKLIIPNTVQYAIVMGFAMNRPLMQTSPATISTAASSLGYSRMGFASQTLSAYIRAQGYHAIPCKNGVGMSVPMAIEAGLGQDGRNGLLITPEFGPNIRIDKVLTSMPLVPDDPIDIGVHEFCRHCKKCARECPSKNITMGERTFEGPSECTHSGVYKWQNDPKKCLAFWVENCSDCGNCIAVCPFTKGKMWAHAVTEWSIKNVPAADGIWLNLDDAFHYGERRDAKEVFETMNVAPYGLDPDKFAKTHKG